jgi:hypothetical protein
MAKEKHEITFHHPSPQVPTDLTIQVKPDEMIWAYGLNTANFPTYGGEVVQILSMYVEDLNIFGTVSTYAEIETIYGWFINYMQIATQGHGGKAGYDMTPVEMTYHHRNWKFNILPKALPGFKYGRDLVAPTWHLQAAVVEFSENFQDTVLSEKGQAIQVDQDSGFEPFGAVTGEIGFNEHNPWSGVTNEQYKAGKTRDEYTKVADWHNNLIPSWLGGDFSSISADYSIPHSMEIQQ